MLFTHITVLRADGTVLPDQQVTVRDDRIAAVTAAGDHGAPAALPGEEIIDGTRHILMPGLVNAHTHVAMTLMRGYGDDMPLQPWLFDRIFPFEAKLTDEDVYWGSLLGIAEMLATGTTSFSDMYDHCVSIANAVALSGIKANLSRGTTGPDPDKPLRTLPAYAEMEALRTRVQADTTGRLRMDVAPHAEYTTHPALLEALAAYAAEHDLRVQMHVSETQSEHLDCVQRHGVTPVGLLAHTGLLDRPITLAHGVWLTDSDINRLAACPQVMVAHCPRSNLKLASGVARIETMRRRGVAVALGTDSAASNNNLNLLEELRTAALLAKGIDRDACALPSSAALYMATRAGALSQGRMDTGDIAAGYRADLVMLDGRRAALTPCHSALSNVLYAAGGGEVALTMVDGRVLYRDGAYTTLDIEQIRREAGRCVAALLHR